jgi:ABC-type transporter Mla subunit MlaD
MADTGNFGQASQRDEGVSHLEAFVALVAETRHLLGERQAALDARSDALGQQAASAHARLGSFSETVTGLAESFATTAHATGSDLARLAAVATELADHVRGAGAEALHASEARFLAAVQHSHESLQQGAAQLRESYSDLEHAVDRGVEHAAAAMSEHEEHFGDLVNTVAEADTTYSQGDFDLHGVLEATTGYLGEALEQYLATVFGGFYDHLATELPPYITDLLQELARTLHRALDEYDSLVESVSGDLASENEALSTQCVRSLTEALDDREDDRARSLDEMRSLLEEGEHCHSSANRGSDIVGQYPPITPLLASAREVAERVQELMDVFNPFNG